ncbi:hypothetical protein SAMD00019534_060320 [Acytostelium subglobosum LB1]|uniref:hypothetical protein n=1 Tax=Acytostelium subglobosum LB1 TaxID=1410327 RepID=UPI000644FE2D|nr:hypothetical protein SAMD00019534_060320 [Acytostelium subglobosum LB1]GAM22857.1 hypothetical protein SAMD00019534_060320 [Acytostelium subglobosum LB1]|eukprot:XP_012754084.1 hypothetical protein SAMD00019534_060320 [Acytostelium subglobosum LB1]
MSNYNSNLLFNTQISYEDSNSTFTSEVLDSDPSNPFLNQQVNTTPVIVQQKVSAPSAYPQVQPEYSTTTVSSHPTPHNSLNQFSSLSIDNNRQSTSLRHSLQPPKNPNQMDITVTDPEKIGDGMNAYVTYKVNTISVLADRPDYKKENSVTRRYSDFLWLRNVLKETKRGIIIPPLPEKAVLNKYNKEFLEVRRRELEKFMNRIAESESLVHSSELAIFLEAQDEQFNTAKSARPSGDNMEQSTVLSPSQPESKGFGKITSFFGNAATSISNFASVQPVRELDPWFDDKKSYIVQLDANLRRLAESVGNVIRKRMELAAAIGELCSSGLTFSSGEIAQSQDIATSIQRMTQVETNIKNGMETLSNYDTCYFEEGLNDYIRVLSAVKELLNDRLDALLNFQNLERKVEAARDKVNKASGTKKDQAQKELDDVQRKCADAKQEFERMSATTKVELARFDSKRNYEVKRILSFVIRMNLEHFLKASDYWREFLTEQHQHTDPNFETNKASWGTTYNNNSTQAATTTN